MMHLLRAQLSEIKLILYNTGLNQNLVLLIFEIRFSYPVLKIELVRHLPGLARLQTMQNAMLQ